MADFSPLGHENTIPNKIDPRQPWIIYELGRQTKSNAIPAVGIKPALAKSHLEISEGGIRTGASSET